MRRILGASLWAALVIIGGCGQTSSDLDRVRLRELDGTEIDLRQYRGRVIFINFWATWCKPCVKEMPTIAAAMEQPGTADVTFLFASNETTEQIREFQTRRGFDFHYVQLQNLEALGIQALPTTFIFNSAGDLVFSEAGYRDWSVPENLSLITNPNPEP